MSLSVKQNRIKKLIQMTTLIIICSFLTSCHKEDEISATVPSPIDNSKILCLGSIQQWYLNNDGSFSEFLSNNSWESDKRIVRNDIDIDYFEGMELHTEKRTTIVAVIDTDIDTDLFSETDNLWKNESEIPEDGLDNDSNGYTDDYFGWDFCSQSGILYADDATTTHGNNLVGILIGCALFPEYVNMFEGTKNQVMAIKAVSEFEEGSIQLLLEAIQYAEQNGADICCLALSTYSKSPELYDLINNSNMLFVVAAGNDGVELGNDVSVYPAMYQLDNIITVADVRCDGKISKTSNFSNQYVHIWAPGTDIICISGSEGYEFTSGTSISTSIVSGICALVRSGWSKELSPGEIKHILIESSKKEEDKSDTENGKGGIASLYQCLASDK